MLQIIQFNGKEQRLYELVAPLVMDSDVIRANHNYPFKTGENYVWFVAIDKQDRVIGFLPMEQKKQARCIINNYYIGASDKRRANILLQLLQEAIAYGASNKCELNSITLIEDKSTFEACGFQAAGNHWKLYVKMIREYGEKTDKRCK